ncbi:MAG: DNA polymerase I [Chlorobiota bacterium]
MERRLYLVDGMSLLFRAYHALMRTGLHAPTGEPTFATFGFANMLLALLRAEQPELLAVVFDTPTPTFRHEQYAEYKATRQAPPEDLAIQLQHVKELLDALGIPRVELPGYEADDVIATLARQAADAGYAVFCVTSDKDFFQLLSDRIRVLRPATQEGTSYQLWDLERLQQEWGLQPEQVVDFLALVGDPVDNVPGVRGVGEKTALQLLHRFGSLEDIFAHLDALDKPSLQQRLREGSEAAFLSRELIRLHVDAPVELSPDALCRRSPDVVALRQLLERLAMRSLRDRLSTLFPELQQSTVPGPTTSVTAVRLVAVTSTTAIEDMLTRLRQAEWICVEVETTGTHVDVRPTALLLYPGGETAYYLPLPPPTSTPQPTQTTLFESPTPQETDDGSRTPEILAKLTQTLQSHSLRVCGHNTKRLLLALKHYSVALPIGFDTMLASYVLNPDDQHNLEPLVQKWLPKLPTVRCETERDALPEASALCENAVHTLHLRKVLEKELRQHEMLQLAEEIEFPLVEVLAQMEWNGVAVDPAILRELGTQYRREQEELRQRIYAEAGAEFNIDSPKQLAEILFEKLHLPSLKKTKTGYSTDVSVLSELALSYPIAALILEYRQLGKLLSTYIEALPQLINPRTGRIHTTYNQTGTSTGRLSSSNPNLQNIPVRGERGREIRKAFIAQRPDYVLLSADYSQIELRIMAYMSGDEGLIAAFKAGHDIHAATAAGLFGVPLEQVTPEMRRAAKVVNFGIMYGLQPFGLAQRLRISKTEAHHIIQQYFARYPGIRRYMEETIERARRLGYVETLCGRRRYFPTIGSRNATVRAAAERAAINAPIQGSAADMMKRAMLAIHRRLRSEHLRTMMILQVHDELLFEVPEEELSIVRELVRTEMQAALPLGDIPIVVELGVGRTWEEAHA